MNCVSYSLRLCLSSGVELQCIPMQDKVHYNSECQRYKQLSPEKKKKKVLQLLFIFLQRLMKSGRDLMKILPMSRSLQNATLRLKWLKGHRCFMNFLTRGGLSGFLVMSQSPERSSITSSGQQVWHWVDQGLNQRERISATVQLCKNEVEKPRELAFGDAFPRYICSCCGFKTVYLNHRFEKSSKGLDKCRKW